jgi:hypothetical protein
LGFIKGTHRFSLIEPAFGYFNLPPILYGVNLCGKKQERTLEMRSFAQGQRVSRRRSKSHSAGILLRRHALDRSVRKVPFGAAARALVTGPARVQLPLLTALEAQLPLPDLRES